MRRDMCRSCFRRKDESELSKRAVDGLQDLLDDAASCRNKMQAASALIDGLSGERVRWTEQSKEFKSQINR